MESLTKNLSEHRRSLPVVCAVFFAAFYLFLWLCIKPQLVYHYFEISRKAPFFKTGWLYLRDCLSYPGGPTQYLAAFLTQLCYFPWIGALCITLIAWGIYRLTVSLTTIAADSPWRVICYVPALLILMIAARYDNPLSIAVAVLAVMFFSVLYGKIAPRLGPARLILFLMVCGVLYYIASIVTFIFVALAALDEFFNRRKLLFGGLYLLFGPAVCWLLGAYVFNLETGEVYLYLNPFIPTRQNIEKEEWARLFEEALFVIFPAIVLLANLERKLARMRSTSRQLKRSRERESSIAKKASDRLYAGRSRWLAQAGLLALIAVPSVLLSFNIRVKRVFQVSYFACREMWPEVLAVAKESHLKPYYPFCNNAVNRALYYTGRLGDEMFAYPQDYAKSDLVFCPIKRGNVVFMERAEVCLELGMVNMAEQIAYEFLEGTDDSPFILKQLALINIVKGRIETAKVFLRALSRNLAYGKEAREILRRLENDPRLERDEHIQHLRSIMITRDYTYIDYDQGYWLEELLSKNRYNKMAFEYLMAHYLLTKQLDKLVENLPRLDDFGYESIPRHYQEAILLYIGTTRKDVDMGERGINVEIIKQYDEINRINQGLNNNMELVRQAVEPKFGHTYFFYFTFGYSGGIR